MSRPRPHHWLFFSPIIDIVSPCACILPDRQLIRNLLWHFLYITGCQFHILHEIYMASNKLSSWNEHVWALLSNDWQIATAFRALAEIAGRDRKISDTCRKGYSCPMGEKLVVCCRYHLPMVLIFTVNSVIPVTEYGNTFIKTSKKNIFPEFMTKICTVFPTMFTFLG